MKKSILVIGILLLTLTNSYATLIDFNSDSFGSKPNGFVSVTDPNVSFYDTVGSNLAVLSLVETNNSPGLIVNGDDASKLQVVFSFDISSFSLDFGNDQRFGSNPVQDAVLDIFRNGTLLDQVFLEVNYNDLMDQTIGYSGQLFNMVDFYYRGVDGNPATLIEVVDNINYAPVPEPSTFLLLGGGLAGLVFYARRRRKE